MNKKVLVLVPGQVARGGVNTYYKALRKHLPEDVIYLERGARKFPYNKSVLAECLRLIKDYSLFIYYLLFKNISIVHTNTSFDKRGVLRDSIYLYIAKIFNKKTIVFYRGWDDDYADILLAKNNFLCKTLLNTDHSIVLASKFKTDLVNAGYTNKVSVETTTVDVELLKDIKPKEVQKTFTLLYLARLQKEKGVYIVIDAFLKLQKTLPNIELSIAGDGQEFNTIKTRIEKDKLENITLHGFVSGDEKSALLNKSDVYIFPTDYKEGMPNSVLEAFAFGIPVITRPIAGMKDVFVHNKNGVLIDSLCVDEYSTAINELINNREYYDSISQYNLTDARKFYSSEVAKRLLDIYANIN